TGSVRGGGESPVVGAGARPARAAAAKWGGAPSRDIEAAVQLGEFRDDLYQRLSVAVIRIPPLRERGEDAVLLARTFLDQASRRYAAPGRPLSPAAEDAIRRHPWPGNVRELQNVRERVVLFTDPDPGPGAGGGRGPPAARGVGGGGPAGAVRVDFPETGLSLEAVERALLIAALERAGGNQTKAARLLAVSRDTLRYRIEK